jgi:hypothetical protein
MRVNIQSAIISLIKLTPRCCETRNKSSATRLA